MGRDELFEFFTVNAHQAFILLALGELGLPFGRIGFRKFSEVGEILDRSASLIARLGERDAVRVQQEDRREAFDRELLGPDLILSLRLGALLLLLRVVEFDEYEILSSRDELLLVEDFLLQSDAPAAPVTAGEVDQDGLLLGLGDLDAFIEIG